MQTKVVKRGFALFRKSLDPEKHIYYNRHYTDHSESLYWPGRIIQPKSFVYKGPSGELVEKITESVFAFLRERCPENFKFDLADYDKIKNNSFFCYNVNLLALGDDLALHLASNVVSKHSKFRPAIEQKARTELAAEKLIFSDIDYANATIREYVEKYAISLEALADLSNNGRRLRFNLDVSDLEKLYDLERGNKLKLDQGHRNVLNRMLNYIY